MGLLSRIADLFGRGDDDALSIPPMDGVLKPNDRLDQAERIADFAEADNLAVLDGQLVCSSGDTLYRIDPESRQAEPIRRFGGAVTMTAASAGGLLAVGVEGAGIELQTSEGWRPIDLGDANRCITAAVFRSEHEMIVAVGSSRFACADWKRDLMSKGSSGRVLAVDLGTGATRVLGEGLAFPYGVAIGQNGAVIVAESWRHRLVVLASQPSARPQVLLDRLPAYPARLLAASGGGFWLALFAPRRQLTELVLLEDGYRAEMMATIPPESWIGPDFSDAANGDQPLQAGSVRQMGIMKPWAPSRSYGLVVRLDASFQPVASFHSRAHGQMHGVASVAELDGRLYAAARGAGALLRLQPEAVS
ncbi:hypothetical protein [Mangrovicella endophytica]|uniref:hypothetical protein n=1 Tax=Mangrovicella endophytica TaxID=2066697 RepID=UPI0012FFE90E|nr:hypothetical protein [Mangrovicella endophytica]